MIIRSLYIALFSFLFISPTLFGQSEFSAGLLPSININHSSWKGWSINGKVESRMNFYSSGTGKFDYLLSDASIIGGKSIGANTKLSIGYLRRFDFSGNANRLMQQLSIIQPIGENRLAHRIAIDQTFYNNSPVVLRLRYRLVAELSLSGREINQGEAYAKLSGEVLNEYRNAEYDLELRLSPALGILFNRKHRLEFGLDFRSSGITQDIQGYNLWTTVQWYIKI